MHTPTRSQNTHLTRMYVDEQGIPEANIRTVASQAKVLSNPSGSNNQLPQLPHEAMSSASYSNPVAAPVSMHLEGANISGSTRLTNVKGDYVATTVNNFGETNDLKALQGFISFEALFDSSVQDPNRQCHPGTRKNVLKRLQDWIDNPNSTDRIFWLYGPAGAGKSAIAQTIARTYTQPKIAATFFFFRSDVKRNDGHKLFTTLAYQLAFTIPAIKDHIVRALSKRPDLPMAGVKTQFERLLVQPFQVLNDDATQQLAPVIIIDGVDECANEDIQQQFLKVIGDAIGDPNFPLRFLIVSRQELHIEQTIRKFRTLTLTLDLAGLDDAHRDIEKYLVDEFSRIASEQSLERTWPGQDIINDIVFKSSGNFIFASVVVRFVGDPYSFAKAQLNIVMNMKTPKAMTPFAVLDQLFLEILQRVPDQDFLKRYLVLLFARISVSGEYGDLSKDDAVLMHVSEQELHANLRRMRSILRFKRGIDVHHKSFVDFLHNPSRSGEYYIPYQDGMKGYLQAVVDSLVRYVSPMMEHPSCHDMIDITHFAPIFEDVLNQYPPMIELPAEAWLEVTQPLVDLQDKLLQQPNSSPTWDFLHCNECTTFHVLRELLHLRIHRGVDSNAASVGQVPVWKLGNLTRIVSPTVKKIKKPTENLDLDAILLSLFAYLPDTMENWSPSQRIINLMTTILRFDYAETATKVHSVSDAQKLVDFLDYMIHKKYLLPVDARHKASLLAFKVYERVPIVPWSYFSNEKKKKPYYTWIPDDQRINIEIFSQTIFASRMIDHCYVPLLYQTWAESPQLISFKVERHDDIFTMYGWQQQLNSSSVSTIQVILSVAKAIQYLHSLGVMLDSQLDLNDILLESGLQPRIRRLCSISQFLLKKENIKRFSSKENVLTFGCLFYQIYSDNDPRPDPSTKANWHAVLERPSRRPMPEYAWQLIQRCCADDPKSRPSMDEVVQEMAGWPIDSSPGQGPFFRALCCFPCLRGNKQ